MQLYITVIQNTDKTERKKVIVLSNHGCLEIHILSK